MAISENRRLLSPASASSASSSFSCCRMMLFVASIVLVASLLLTAQPSDANRQFKRVFCNFDGCHSKRTVNSRLSLAELLTRALRPDGEMMMRQPEQDNPSSSSTFSSSFDDYEDIRASYPSLKKTSASVVDGPETTYKEPEMERLVQEMLPSNRG